MDLSSHNCQIKIIYIIFYAIRLIAQNVAIVIGYLSINSVYMLQHFGLYSHTPKSQELKFYRQMQDD